MFSVDLFLFFIESTKPKGFLVLPLFISEGQYEGSGILKGLWMDFVLF